LKKHHLIILSTLLFESLLNLQIKVKMIYTAILAGGTGTRLGIETPKQFLPLGNKTILRYTTEKFFKISDIIIIAVPNDRIKFTEDIFSDTDFIKVISGGETRFESLERIIKSADFHKGDIIITHDAARPFVSERLIEETAMAAAEFGAATAAFASSDTVAFAENGFIKSVPQRNAVLCVQTPQAFDAVSLFEITKSLSDCEKNSLTDASGIFTAKGFFVRCVQGEKTNFKITDKFDYDIALNWLDSF
jgi:2-C-methyl-D-erythritol 4-phosphate cytidylyltransferase